jgi:hypothetical protein
MVRSVVRATSLPMPMMPTRALGRANVSQVILDFVGLPLPNFTISEDHDVDFVAQRFLHSLKQLCAAHTLFRFDPNINDGV